MLGQYVGTALDGLSGGGGAVGLSCPLPSVHLSSLSLSLQVNNGQFLGNFLGTVLAALSAVFIPFIPLYIPTFVYFY